MDGVDDFGAVDAGGEVAFEVGGFAGAGDDGEVAALTEVGVEFAGVTHVGEPVFAGGVEAAEGDDDEVAEGGQAGGAGVGAAAADDEGAGAGEGGFGGGDAGADITDAFTLFGVVEVGRLDELEAELLKDGGQAFDLQLVERPAEDVPVLGAFGVGGLAGGLLLFEPELQAGDDGEAGFGDGFEKLAAAFDGVQLLGEAMGLRPDVAVDAGSRSCVRCG